MGRDDDDDRYYHKSHYDLNNKVMLTAIISLSVVVILVSVLHVYARCVLRRQARRRAALRDANFITSASQIHSIVPPRPGLDPLVIASLPLFVFKKSDDHKGTAAEMESIECAVCLSGLQEGEMARTLPNCKHTFHAECIDKWFGQHSTCPICRTEAEPRLRLAPEPREGVVLPTAPPLERANSAFTSMEDTSDQGGNQQSSLSAKIGGSSSRLSRSFRRILSRERSFQRVQSCGQEDGVLDLERQQ